ncbi:MAG: PAS domain S-box protein [Candidatus Cyclobacteriaceae bacterium M3_2C_046]
MTKFLLPHNREPLNMQNITDIIFNSVLDSVDNQIAVIDKEFNYLIFNENYRLEFEGLYGLQLEKGANVINVLGHLPDNQMDAVALWSRSLQGETIEVFRNLVDQNNQIRMYKVKYQPLCNDQNEVIGAQETVTDITQHKTIEKDLHQLIKNNEDQQIQIRTALNAMLEGVLIFDPKGRITYCNEEANRILLQKLDEKDRSRLSKNIKAEDEQGKFIKYKDLPIMKAYQGLTVKNQKLKLYIYDKEILWFESSAAPIYNIHHKLLGVIITFKDITLAMRAELERKESEDRFHSLADNISQLTWMAYPDGAIFWCNKRWFDYTGTTLPEMEGWGWTKILHPEHLESVVKQIRLAWQSGEKWENTIPLKGKNNDYRWFLCRVLPIKDQQGKVIRWIGTNTDITENKLLQEKNRNEHDLLKTIVDSIPVMLVIYDPELKTIRANKAFEKLTGWNEDDQQNIMERAYPDQEYRAMVQKYMQSLQSGFRDFKFMTKWGKSIETSWANVSIPDGRQVGIGIDISTRKSMENEILSANQLLEHKNMQLNRLNEFMENLLYMAAHDLRSPVKNLQIMMDLINNAKSTQDKTNYFPSLKKMIDRLANVIQGMSEIIRAQQDVSQQFRSIDLANTLNELIHDFDQEVKACGGEIHYEIKGLKTISYNEIFLESILKNLITNAIKYRDDQKQLEVHISVERLAHHVLLTVQDNGIGINLEYNKNLLFRPFKRLTDKASGTGIGLFIIKNFIERNGGYIKVESKEGHGSQFYCYLKEY